MQSIWLDRFLPASLRDGSEAHRRARLVVGATALLATVGCFFAYQTSLSQDYLQTCVLGFTSALTIVNIAALHRGLPLMRAAQLTVIEGMVALTIVCYNGHGLRDGAERWLMIMPLIGGLLVTPVFGFMLAAGASIVALWLNHLGATPGFFREPPSDYMNMEMLVGVTVSFGVAYCANLFESARVRAYQQMQVAMTDLERSKLEAEKVRNQESLAKDAAVAEVALKNELAARMLRNVRELSANIVETRDSMSRMTEGSRAIAETVSGFAVVAKESSRTTDEVDKLDVQTQSAIEEISSALQQTSTSIEEMRMTLREVARNVESLLRNADSTNASMAELDASVQQVEKNARGATDLSTSVMRDAERGKSAVSASKRGMDTIKVSSRTSSETVRALGSRVAEITGMLNVINQVADRTNMLALNAAIIAAQAGEAGRGFAVVADEIKTLADETTGSIKGIDSIVKSLERESMSALDAISRSELAVEEGVLLVEEAELALAEIVRSTDQSSTVVRSIAQATGEQAQSIRFVAKEMERVTQTVSNVANTVREQARTSEQIAAATEQLGALTPRVQASSAQQSAGSRRVRDAVLRLAQMVDRLKSVQNEQSADGDRILHAIESLHSNLAEQLKSIERLGG